MNRFVLNFLLLFLASAFSVKGQSIVHRDGVGVRWHGGFLFAHHPDMRHLVSQHFNAWEVNYQRRFSGDKDWQHHYRLPSWGITLMAMPVVDSHIGAAYTALPYFYLPLTHGQRINLNLKLGAGLGVLTNPFDRENNNKNIAISTRMNAAIQLGVDLSVNIIPRLDWNSGLFITHFSNGAVRMPNLGLNFVTLSSGFSYRFGPEAETAVSKTDYFFNPVIRWSLFAGAGVKQSQVKQGNVLPAVSLQLLGEKRLSKKFTLGAGAEFNYNHALPLAYEAKDLVPDNAAALRGGLLVSGAFHFGNMEILAQMGGYVLDPGLIDGRFFNRFGIRHQITRRMKLNLTLRTHYAKADHFELGLVYRLSVL